MSNEIESFLTVSEEQDIIEAIRLAELNTSGEIKVHIEKTSSGDIINRTLEVFIALKMDQTKLRNAVLIYVAAQDKSFAIYGDTGINKMVPSNFWDNIKDLMQSDFKCGNFKCGIIEGIQKTGEKLKNYFPYSTLDTNELSNDISKG